MIGLHPTCYTTSAYLQINLLMFIIGPDMHQPKLPNSVTLSEAKGLSRWVERCFAALSMTGLYLC